MGRPYAPIVRTALYVAIALVLIVFGYLALFSIGWPFALTGILMLALIGERGRVDVLAPALAWRGSSRSATCSSRRSAVRAARPRRPEVGRSRE